MNIVHLSPMSHQLTQAIRKKQSNVLLFAMMMRAMKMMMITMVMGLMMMTGKAPKNVLTKS